MTTPMGYCVRCRERRPMKDATTIINKRGVPMLQAICPADKCGRKVNTFVSKKISPKGEGPENGPEGPARPKPSQVEPPKNAPAVAPDHPPRRTKGALLPKKRQRTERKGDARRALQVPDDEEVQEDDTCRESQDGP